MIEIESRLGERERTRRETLEWIEAVENGESDDSSCVVNFERLADAALFLRWLSPHRRVVVADSTKAFRPADQVARYLHS